MEAQEPAVGGASKDDDGRDTARADALQRQLNRIDARLTLAGVPGQDVFERLDQVLGEVASLRARVIALEGARPAMLAAAGAGASSGTAVRIERPTSAGKPGLRGAIERMLEILATADAGEGIPVLQLFSARRRLEAVIAGDPGHPLRSQIEEAIARLYKQEAHILVSGEDAREARRMLEQVLSVLEFTT